MTNGMPVPLSRAVEQIQKYRHDLQTMKGGLTISGGEPLMQHRFVLKVFAAAKQMGVHTALDSNGYLGDRLSDADLAAIDLVLLDLKAMTPDLHRRLTGMDNQPIHEFARRLAAARKPIWVRFVLVPGWTDDMAEVERIAAFAAELGQRRAGGRAAVPSDGPLQMGEARDGLSTQGHPTTLARDD